MILKDNQGKHDIKLMFINRDISSKGSYQICIKAENGTVSVNLDLSQKLDALPNIGRKRLQHIGVLARQALQLILQHEQRAQNISE